MKKLFFAFALTSVLLSCKKETSNPPKTDPTNPSSSAVVTSIDCASKQLTGVLKKGEAANSVSFELFYKGGNGKTFSSQSVNSTGVLGLTAKLSSGVLENGDGSVIYSITGMPTSSGPANFAIALGGKSCTITIAVDDVTQNPTSGYGPNITDAENNTYKTVFIGTQQWMAENLKVSKYSDGTTIPNITDNTQWQNNTTGAWAYHNNVAANNAKYGKLYNWYAVSKTTNGNKNVCPTGWHVPTDAEWTVLTEYLGGEGVAGGKLKEVGTTSWNSPNTSATNTSLFTGLPGGLRGDDGNYNTIGGYGNWWSSTESSTYDAWLRTLYYYYGNAAGGSSYKNYGFSVRCLRD